MSRRTRKKLSKKILDYFLDNIMSWGCNTLDQFISTAFYLSKIGFPLSDEEFGNMYDKADSIDINYHLSEVDLVDELLNANIPNCEY